MFPGKETALFIVISIPNCFDPSAPTAPRIITEDPARAIREARKVFANEDDRPYVANVIIYQMLREKVYTALDSRGSHQEPAKTIVYVAWEHPHEHRIVEDFYGSLASFVKSQVAE